MEPIQNQEACRFDQLPHKTGLVPFLSKNGGAMFVLSATFWERY